MLSSHSAAVYGAFIMEGMQDGDYGKALELWQESEQQGCLEFVTCACDVVPYIEALIAAAEKHGCDFPGVYDYEVVSEYGSWFVKETIAHEGEVPTDPERKKWLLEATLKFFLQDREPPPPEKEAALRSALEASAP